ncbi:hypothetical protein D9M68_734800 [compost metagenome]
MTEREDISDGRQHFAQDAQNRHQVHRQMAQCAVAPGEQAYRNCREYPADKHILTAVHLRQQIFRHSIADGECTHGEEHKYTCAKIS